MANKTSFIFLILPDAHGSATPQVAELILYDTINHLVCQSLSLLEGHDILFAFVISVQARIRTYQHLMITVLIEICHGFPLHQHLPSIRSEHIVIRIIAAEVRRGTQPQFPLAVYHHRHDPVVVQSAFLFVRLAHIKIAHFLGFQVVRAKSLRIG